MNNAILLISCKDSKGITAAVTGFIASHNGNIIHADQHIDEQSLTFFMRVEWSLEAFDLKQEQLAQAFEVIAQHFQMQWELYFTDQRPKVAIYVGKHLHCLYDFLYRYKTGQFNCVIPLILSNHPEASALAHDFGIKFHEFALFPNNKAQEEAKQLAILSQNGIDLVILARYQQILSPQFVSQYPNKMINIHHSFLPAFVGQNPYLQAYEKGVKLIGATAHYVTADLDQGPIIEQDTVRVSHRDSKEDLMRKGQDLEKMVLSRAVRWHLEHKVLSYGHKTVIFD